MRLTYGAQANEHSGRQTRHTDTQTDRHRQTDKDSVTHIMLTTPSRPQHQNVAFIKFQVKLGRVKNITSVLAGITVVSLGQ